MTTKKDDLVAYFEQYGTIYKVIIPVDDSKKCAEFKGYALVSFEDPAVLDTILSNPKHNILNRRVHCSRALGKKEARNMTTLKTKKKLFIGGLSQKTTEDTLIKYFSQFGALGSAYLIYDKNSNNSRCFGFVEYYNPEDAERVHAMKEHIVDRKPVITKFQVLKKNKEREPKVDGQEGQDLSPNMHHSHSPTFQDQSSQNLSYYHPQAGITSPQHSQNQYVNVQVGNENYQQQYYAAKDPQAQYQDYYYVDDKQPKDASYPTSYNAPGTQYGQEVVYVDDNGCYYDYSGYYQSEQGHSEVNYGYHQSYDTGYDAAYNTVYDPAYPTGYDAGYGTGYDAAYPTGYDTGYGYGYPQGYDYQNFNAEKGKIYSHTSGFSEIESHSGFVGPQENSGVVSAYNVRSRILDTQELSGSKKGRLSSRGSEKAKPKSTGHAISPNTRISDHKTANEIKIVREKVQNFEKYVNAKGFQSANIMPMKLTSGFSD